MAPMTQVFLRDVSGSLSVVEASTVGDVRARVGDDVRLVSAARDLSALAPETTLAEAGVLEGSTLESLARLVGGGKKRKKKTYTKPKKLKHKHKKVKMAALKYYKISADGKVERLRKECPADICGAGIFFANHADRMYCGKCGLTYVHEDQQAAA